ncbi:MAG: hypothetical protein NXI04_23015 [Planctomycetaceae bacterium]|nr:hypothetical protein [Planctomycetaceae bacterium]
MRNADFHSPMSRLNDAMLQLEAAWRDVQEHWSDGVAQKVEDDYLVPLHSQVQAMNGTVEKLSSVLTKAERACMHPREHGPIL